MMKSQKIILMCVAALLCSTLSVGTVYLDETWADGDRTNQNLPESAKWITFYDSSTLTATSADGGSMTQDLQGSGPFITYFTEQLGDVASVGTGEHLRLTYEFSLGGPVQTHRLWRVGLLNSSGITNYGFTERHSEDGDFNNSNRGTTGYMVAFGTSSAGTLGNIWYRDSGDINSNNLMGSTNIYTAITNRLTDRELTEDLAADTLYTGVFEVYNLGGEVLVRSALTRDEGQVTVYDYSVLDDEALYTDFDMLGFLNHGNLADTYTLHSVNVTVIPEPAMLTLFGLGGLALWKKRKMRRF